MTHITCQTESCGKIAESKIKDVTHNWRPFFHPLCPGCASALAAGVSGKDCDTNDPIGKRLHEFGRINTYMEIVPLNKELPDDGFRSGLLVNGMCEIRLSRRVFNSIEESKEYDLRWEDRYNRMAMING